MLYLGPRSFFRSEPIKKQFLVQSQFRSSRFFQDGDSSCLPLPATEKFTSFSHLIYLLSRSDPPVVETGK